MDRDVQPAIRRIAAVRRGLSLAALIGFSACAGAAPPWQIWQSPAMLATPRADDLVGLVSSHCLAGCRYDRSGVGAEAASANPYPLRWLYQDDGEAVLFDERGPGAVTRIWMTTGYGVSRCIDPAIHVRFYVDGATTPTLDMPLASIFDGSTPPFTAPLVADHDASSGGYVSYVPIAYATSLKISLTHTGDGPNPCSPDARHLLWYQIAHHSLVPGSAVSSFTPTTTFPAWRDFLAHAGDDPWHGMLPVTSASTTLHDGEAVVLANRSGAGWLRGIRLELPRADYPLVRLRITIDGDTAVDLPLDRFFATATGATTPARGVLLGEDAGGWLYAWLPMPYANAAVVELVGDGLATPVTIASELSFDTATAPIAARFHASHTYQCVASGDATLFTANGAGRIVGIAQRFHADGIVSRSYLEGDERLYRDGQTAPAWYGTGVEDFYNAGFYFDSGAFAAALSGATEVDPDGQSTTAAYRWLLGDPMGWSRGIRLTQEAGFSPGQPIPACIDSVVYAYRAPRAATVVYDHFDLGTARASAHAYAPPTGATCAPLAAQFEDEPPSSRQATVCRYAAGSAHFSFHVADAVAPLRLTRSFDAGDGQPGTSAGSAGATILVNGVVAGHFPPAAATPSRRWQQQTALLDVAAPGAALNFTIVPDFSAAAPSFSASAYQLAGGWKDRIFADGFEP